MTHSYRLHYFHIIWSTKNRQNWLQEEVSAKLYGYLHGILKNHKTQLIIAGGMPNHVHLLIEMGFPDNFSSIIRNVKSHSSLWLRNNHEGLKHFCWQEGYASFSVSHSSVSAVKKYIMKQSTHHAKWSFDEEYKKLLKCHDINYDERFVLG